MGLEREKVFWRHGRVDFSLTGRCEGVSFWCCLGKFRREVSVRRNDLELIFRWTRFPEDHIFKRVFWSDTFRLHLMFRWIVFLMRRNTVRARTRVSQLMRFQEGTWDYFLWLDLDSPCCNSTTNLCGSGFLKCQFFFLFFEMAVKQDHLIPISRWCPKTWRKRPTSWLPAKRDTRWELKLWNVMGFV